jgi:hypothetical protein
MNKHHRVLPKNFTYQSRMADWENAAALDVDLQNLATNIAIYRWCLIIIPFEPEVWMPEEVLTAARMSHHDVKVQDTLVCLQRNHTNKGHGTNEGHGAVPGTPTIQNSRDKNTETEKKKEQEREKEKR